MADDMVIQRLMQIHADIAQWRTEVEPELAVSEGPGGLAGRVQSRYVLYG